MIPSTPPRDDENTRQAEYSANQVAYKAFFQPILAEKTCTRQTGRKRFTSAINALEFPSSPLKRYRNGGEIASGKTHSYQRVYAVTVSARAPTSKTAQAASPMTIQEILFFRDTSKKKKI